MALPTPHLEELVARKDEILNKTVNGIWAECIYPLICLINRTPKDEMPCTIRLGDISMHMSTEGIARWKEDFQPFRNFEHIHPFLFPLQKEMLETALKEARERGVKI